MKIRNQKRILLFLKDLLGFLMDNDGQLQLSQLLSHYTESELREMVKFIYEDKWNTVVLDLMQHKELKKLILTDFQVLRWTIHQFEQQMIAVPEYSQNEVDNFFKRTQNEIHYLASKPVTEWDTYDFSNYRSLMIKTGVIKKVFAIFTSDVINEQKYEVTTKPTSLFDTKEEAEEELERIAQERNIPKTEFVIHSLWRITKN